MRINTNISAINAQRISSINQSEMSKSIGKLSTGRRINSASDDAAGLAISEKLRSQIRGLDRLSKNSQDSISLIQTAEGALSETHEILQRMRELAVQSANDTNTDEDRTQMQQEVNQLTIEIDRIAETTEFNTKKILNVGDDLSSRYEPSVESNELYIVNRYKEISNFGSEQTADATKNNDPAQQISQEDYDQYKVVIDNVIDGIVNKGWLEVAEEKISEFYGLDGSVASGIKPNLRINLYVGEQNGVLASVSSAYSNNGLNVVGKDLILNIDLLDFSPGSGDSGSTLLSNSSLKAFDDRILAHELVHAYIANYVSSEQVTGSYGNVPTWFNEGTSELIHGADERVQGLAGDTLESGESDSYVDAAAGTWAADNEAYAGGYLMARAIQENGTGGDDTLKNIFNELQTSSLDGLTNADFVTAVTNNTNFVSGDLATLEADIKTWVSTNLITGGNNQVDLTNTDTGAIGGLDVSGGPIQTATSVIDNSLADDTDGQPLSSFDIVLPDLPTPEVTPESEDPVEPETPVTPETPAEPETPVNPETPTEPETPVDPETPTEPEVTNPETNLSLGSISLVLFNSSASSIRVSGNAGTSINTRDGKATAHFAMIDPIGEEITEVPDEGATFVGSSAHYSSNSIRRNVETSDATVTTSKYALDITSQENANAAITIFSEAISDISSYRSLLGAKQNRLEHTIKSYDNYAENLQAAESRIRDVDMAKEMMNFTKYNILQQASQSMLAQANQNTKSILQLLN